VERNELLLLKYHMLKGWITLRNEFIQKIVINEKEYEVYWEININLNSPAIFRVYIYFL